MAFKIKKPSLEAVLAQVTTNSENDSNTLTAVKWQRWSATKRFKGGKWHLLCVGGGRCCRQAVVRLGGHSMEEVALEGLTQLGKREWGR